MTTNTARSIGTATITFGLVSVPVKLFTTNESSDEVHFNMLHDEDGARLKQQYVCTKCEQVVDRDHTVKGYEHAKGQYVICTADEMKALDAVATERIEIVETVDASAVDPLFIEKTYYLGPDKGAERGYALLAEAMADSGLVSIASYSARGREHVVMVRPFRNGLAMHQLRYQREVKDWSAVPVVAPSSSIKPSEIGLAKKLLQAIEVDAFDASKYKDRVQERILTLIQAKIDGNEIVMPEVASPVTTIDLLEALRASLDVQPAPVKKSEAARRPAARASSKKRKRAA